MYNQLLQLYQHPFTLTRFGRKGDGGYVVPKEIMTNHLISCGILDDVSFDDDYINAHKDARVFAYDGTIETFPSNNKLNYVWEKLNIGEFDSQTEISFNTIFAKYNLQRVNMKVDIEGAEYAAFRSLSEQNLANIDCLVLEVHEIQNRYIDFVNLMNKLMTQLVLIHRHDNNCGSYFTYKNLVFAAVYEFTFINKRFVESLVPNNPVLPLEGLDFRNC